MKSSHLRSLGVYGYDSVESVILAALITEDPLLLIGKAGTGKTFLLNSLSEALGLEHRHYNAALISFDDLVGFPYPKADGSDIRYLQTPATVWQAESVLVDELSRCKPEHQNRFFSLIHERRLQGIKLDRLRHRWAAMNPASLDGAGGYFGCDPLDPALADRFAFIITVADWDELTEEDRRAVADPRGDGVISDDGGRLRQDVDQWRQKFLRRLGQENGIEQNYARLVATALWDARVRLSPRRVRQLARNLIALSVVSPLPLESRLRLGLRWSLPHRATAEPFEETVLEAAHQAAWSQLDLSVTDRWLFEFHRLTNLADQVTSLLSKCPDPDTGTVAVTQFVAHQHKVRAAAFALAVFPALLAEPDLPVGIEGVHELGQIAAPALHMAGETRFYSRDFPYAGSKERFATAVHPEWVRLQETLKPLSGYRLERARQWLGYVFVHNLPNPETVLTEPEFFEACQAAQKALKARRKAQRNIRDCARKTQHGGAGTNL